jgi:hypothetical protein
MTYLSILDKLKIFISLLISSSYLLVFTFVLILIAILRFTKKINGKKASLMICLSLVLTFLGVILTNYDILSKTFDNFIDIIFTNIYFPSIYVYLFMIISTYVISIVSAFSRRMPKVYKNINYFMAFILNFFLVINLNVIANDKIDIFSDSSMYTNINLVSMLELSMNIYILWLIAIAGVYAVNHITEFIVIHKGNKTLEENPVSLEVNSLELNLEEPTQEVKDEFKINPVLLCDGEDKSLSVSEVVNTEIEKEITPSLSESVIEVPKFINNNVIEEISKNTNNNENKINDNSYTFNQYAHIEAKRVVNPILDQILQNALPLQEDANKNSDKFTLNDYKLFSKMLKEVLRMHMGSTIKINDLMDADLLVKFGHEDYSLYQKMLKSFI